MVVDANISGNVQVKDNAMVMGGVLSGNAIISDQAFVENDTIYDNAIVNMRARVSNYKLHGNIKVGGDVIVYNKTGDCDNGTYYRMTNYYQDNLLECDNRTNLHPANTDVNNIIVPFTNTQMSTSCNCNNYPSCLTLSINNIANNNRGISFYPNPVSNYITFEFTEKLTQNGTISIYNILGAKMETVKVDAQKIKIDFSNYTQGIYQVVINDTNLHWSAKIIKNDL